MTTITLATANALDQLGLAIFDPKFDPTTMSYTGPATGLRSPDPGMDAQLAAAIGGVLQVIDGRTLAQARYTLNVTNALQLRAKHWYLRGVSELDSSSFWPCTTAFEYMPTRGGVQGGCNSFGWTIGLATCAAICHTWAAISRMWLMRNYPLAVTQYTGPLPDPAAAGGNMVGYYSQNPPA